MLRSCASRWAEPGRARQGGWAKRELCLGRRTHCEIIFFTPNLRLGETVLCVGRCVQAWWCVGGWRVSARDESRKRCRQDGRASAVSGFDYRLLDSIRRAPERGGGERGPAIQVEPASCTEREVLRLVLLQYTAAARLGGVGRVGRVG